MPLTCNLDSRGKALRLIMGAVFALDGLTLLFLWAWRTGSHVGWITSILMIVAGAFMIFEGRTGWCALRAMGMKTPV
jgi:hypothetical protein